MSGDGPAWRHDDAYYARLTRGTSAATEVEIRTDPVRGKGLFAAVDLPEGHILLLERALAAAQNFEESVPVCAHCLASLEVPLATVRRVLNDATGLDAARKEALLTAFAADDAALPAAGLGPAMPAPVLCAQCPAAFCSERCRRHAWALHHAALCTAAMSDDGRGALREFHTRRWQQGGVDYADTHALALRLVARWLSAVRCQPSIDGALSSEDGGEAMRPLRLLIRAPMSRFHFPFLHDNGANDKDGREKDALRQAQWATFQRHRHAPEEHPAVIRAAQSVRGAHALSKDALVAQGHALVLRIFGLADVVADSRNTASTWPGGEGQRVALRAALPPERWSELLGAVLLNGQERTPSSPYFARLVAVRADPQHRSYLKRFHKLLKAEGVDPRALRVSTKGQAVYAVGCLFNHSCDPNVEMMYDEATNDETLVATLRRAVRRGEELCISYIDECAPFAARQQQLQEHYLFECQCPQCAADGGQGADPCSRAGRRDAEAAAPPDGDGGDGAITSPSPSAADADADVFDLVLS